MRPNTALKRCVLSGRRELAVYEKDNARQRKATVAPLADRLVLFWSDTRVPHEVLETHKERFTVTIWFFDEAEWEEACEQGIIPKPTHLDDEDGSAAAGGGEAAAPAEGPGDAEFRFVSADAPPEAREPDGSDLRPMEPEQQPAAAPPPAPSATQPARGGAPAHSVRVEDGSVVAVVSLPGVANVK